MKVDLVVDLIIGKDINFFLVIKLGVFDLRVGVVKNKIIGEEIFISEVF